jgi:biopolymer transport protein ExbD
MSGEAGGQRSPRRRRSAGGGLPAVPGFGKDEVRPDINVTPMIDVMMCLLIIFMVVTPVITEAAALLPSAVNVTAETEGDVVVLGIDESGVFRLGQDVVLPAELEGVLRETYLHRPGDHLIYLRSDRRVDYRFVLDAIAAARAAGVRRIGLVASPVVPEEMAAARAAVHGGGQWP